MEYKENCGFRKLGCCLFNVEDCKGVDSGFVLFCEMYDLEFSAKSLKKEIKIVKDKIKKIAGDNLKLKKIKEMIKAEKKDKDDIEVINYKKQIAEIKDLSKGLEYLEKAYRYCKRTGK